MDSDKFSSMENWIDDLPICKKSGVGFQTNQKYQAGFGRRELHEREDRSFHVNFPCSSVSLYGVFDGHDSARVAHFSAQKLPAELLLDVEIADSPEAVVNSALSNAFDSVEKGYLELINEILVQRTNLQIQIPEGLSSFEVYNKYPLLLSRLQELDKEIQGGTSATISLIQGNNLFIANVGDVRAVLCTKAANGSLHMEQLSVDHTIRNAQELQRLANIGLDIEKIQKTRRIFNQDITRSLGDFPVKGGYKEIECLRSATSEPIISAPFLSGCIPIDSSFYFMAIFTSGFYKTLEEISESDQVNKDIVALIAAELNEQSTIDAVAQSVVDKVCRAHQDEFARTDGAKCREREDMTLLVRLFSAHLGKKSTPVTPPIPVADKKDARHNAKSLLPMPVTVPFKGGSEYEEDQLMKKLPRLIMPSHRKQLMNFGSFSQPSSRVSTPVTIAKTASTPPCPLYRNLSKVSECSSNLSKSSSSLTPDTQSVGSTPTTSSSTASVLSPFSTTLQPATDKTLVDARTLLTMAKDVNALSLSDDTPLPDEDDQESDDEDANEDDANDVALEKGHSPDDGKVDPYVDFTEFMQKIEEAGGEKVVFADFVM
eukprot:gene9239-10213_t